MNKTDVLRLAQLARIEISDEEANNLTHEFESILNYVGEVKEVEKEEILNRNVMREDGEPHESGIHTEDLLNSAPDREGEYVRVKKIL